MNNKSTMLNAPNKLLKHRLKIYLAIILSVNIFPFYAKAQHSNPSPIHFPTPPNTDNMLFYVQRDPNINTLIYSVNLKENGEINSAQPIAIYWIRYAEKGEKKELGYIQKKFAYGITSKEILKDKFEIRFVSHKVIPFYLAKNKGQKYEITVSVNGKQIIVKRLFIRIEGGSFWLPNVKYALIEGFEANSKLAVSERIGIK